jgi:hypothetical protein
VHGLLCSPIHYFYFDWTDESLAFQQDRILSRFNRTRASLGFMTRSKFAKSRLTTFLQISLHPVFEYMISAKAEMCDSLECAADSLCETPCIDDCNDLDDSDNDDEQQLSLRRRYWLYEW